MINAFQLKAYVIEPVLDVLGLDEDIAPATNILSGTAAVESNMGQYVTQLGGGPALGIFQMEPKTHKDIWVNYLLYHPQLAKKVMRFQRDTQASTLVYNHWYAAAMCRVHYYRSSHPMPAADDIEGLATMWKEVYNTKLGKGTVEKFIVKYHQYVE